MILYRTSGPWGGGIGGNLTASQVDGNFYDVAMRVQYLELNPSKPVQISAFTSVGDQLYIHMSNGVVNGPLKMPVVRWIFRGNWAAGNQYLIDDVVVGPDNAVYLVALNHFSADTFSPGANDGQGHEYYTLLLRVPSASIPPEGVRGTVLTKASDDNYDLVWAFTPPPPGGLNGEVYRKFSDSDGDAGWDSIALGELFDVSVDGRNDGDYLAWSDEVRAWINIPRPGNNVRSDTSWYPVVGDEGRFMVLDNGTADTTVIIPNDYQQPFDIGTELHIHQNGTGIISVEGDEGVLILKHASFSNKLLGQYATATVKKTWTNEWRLFGLLAAV